ncbi:MAG: HEPN domain-containing protein [Chloroflexi bacterium]|nr:HEPN domain-containing protein [Chloroflexota bacterium]
MRKNGLQRLTAKEKRALDELVVRLRDKYAEQIAQVILFGSRARGDATWESDFDLLIVTKNGGKKLEQALDRFIDPIGFEHNLVFAPHVISEKELERKQTKEPFYRSIVSEGVDLFAKTPRRVSRGKPLVYRPPTKGFKMDENAKIQIKIRLERARADVSAAHSMLDQGFFPRGVSTAYFAIFNFTTAVLLTLDLVRTKHSGVEGAFSEYFIRDKRIEEEYKDIFNRSRKERELADYKLKEYTEAEARQILADCERFVARMEQYLRDVGAIE